MHISQLVSIPKSLNQDIILQQLDIVWLNDNSNTEMCCHGCYQFSSGLIIIERMILQKEIIFPANKLHTLQITVIF